MKKLTFLLLLAVVISLSIGSLTFLQAQTCSNRTQYPLAVELRNRPPDANGIIHVTYGFSDSNIPASQMKAFQTALSEWNNYSSSTKVVFEPVATGAIADLDFKQSDDPTKTGGCAAYQSGDDRIFYSSGWQQRADASPDAGATVFVMNLGIIWAWVKLAQILNRQQS